MNHKWDNDKCVRCGITREKKEYKKVARTYSTLGKDGCFYDVPVYQFGTAYHYGKEHQFNRPECATP